VLQILKMENKLICLINRESDADNAFINVKKMVEEKYSTNDEYKNCIVVLGYNNGRKIEYYRELYPNKKIIIYQLEQLFEYKSLWFNPKSKRKFVIERTNHVKDWLDKCDEIWEYDLNNKWFLEELGYKKIYFKPMLFCESIKNIPNKETPKYDILFFGSINEKRAKILSILNQNFNIKIVGQYSLISEENIKKYNLKIDNTDFSNNLNELISDSKIILNLHYYESSIQEQVRIFHLLINNKCVVSEKSKKNYFGDLITEFNDNTELINTLNELLVNEKWKNINVSERFKNKDLHNLKISAVYNSFYNVDMLQKSIESIINVVHKVFVIHQTVSFAGNPEPEKNKDLFKDLIKRGYIDKILYFDKVDIDRIDGMIMKRNEGLDLSKTHNCDYILTLDNDECYNDEDLYNNVIEMDKQNIETLYSPIISYYHNDKFFFKEKFYVSSLYKINDRKYKRGLHSSIVCDPARKMKEGKYKLSNLFMHHLSYFRNSFEEKLGNKIMFLDPNKKDFQHKIYDRLISWKPGQSGLIIDTNKKGENFLAERQLYTIKSSVNLFDNKIFDLSVIIPTFNNVKFIDECISSILNSSKKSNVEILIGIDGCQETLNFINGKSYDSSVKFYFFGENVGPYIIKNSLSKISNSDNLLFFDSDDVAYPELISETINNLQSFELIKPMYHDFTGDLNQNDPTYKTKSKNWGEGVFAIKKEIFINYNGFEGWKCAADSDFMGRMYKNNIKVKLTEHPLFYRRIHADSLTKKSETGYHSSLRKEYHNISKNKRYFGPLSELKISQFSEVGNHKYEQIVECKTEIVQETQQNVKTQQEIILDLLNKPKVVVNTSKSKINEKREMINNFNRFIPQKKRK
jgi:glycosyltransferase involved in cell wall biosynthesis